MVKVNKWVEHVRKFAIDNNLTYTDSLKHPNILNSYICSQTYEEKLKEKRNIANNNMIICLLNKIKNIEDDDDRRCIKKLYNSYNQIIRDGIKNDHIEYYNKLFGI